MLAEAIDRLERAIEGKPRGTLGRLHEDPPVAPALCAVSPADVVAVCDSVPEAKQTERVRLLRRGSFRSRARNDEYKLVVYIQVDDCAHLLEQAKG